MHWLYAPDQNRLAADDRVLLARRGDQTIFLEMQAGAGTRAAQYRDHLGEGHHHFGTVSLMNGRICPATTRRSARGRPS